MDTIKEAIKQLNRSDRGRVVLRKLKGFLLTPEVDGLDGPNCQATVHLLGRYLLGGCDAACEVREALGPVPWELAWTKEVPEEDGWYWFAEDGRDPKVVRIEMVDGVGACFRDERIPILAYAWQGLWAGPLAKPHE